jgi:hypothetical protein
VHIKFYFLIVLQTQRDVLYQQQKSIHSLIGIRNRDPINQTATDPLLGPHGYRNQNFRTIRGIYLLKFEFMFILSVTIYRMIAEAQAARKLIARYHISTCLCCWGEFIAYTICLLTSNQPMTASTERSSFVP